ncbi:hypothetical protein DCAR_0519591 [Daucus carota subsp. sativus]|uniref:Uncharacterized protein n=1 Tax=Daucus carota subsp. sativus TaxID=79200 RepID=A0A161XQK8_DAUCS|nr:hypothetical protein DCAR_0519591 [Daucus carota subsp. sativus]
MVLKEFLAGTHQTVLLLSALVPRRISLQISVGVYKIEAELSFVEYSLHHPLIESAHGRLTPSHTRRTIRSYEMFHPSTRLVGEGSSDEKTNDYSLLLAGFQVRVLQDLSMLRIVHFD